MMSESPLEKLLQKVRDQAEDHCLWFEAEYASEAYLQQELRLLHKLIEELIEEVKLK